MKWARNLTVVFLFLFTLWVGLRFDWGLFSSHPRQMCPFCDPKVLSINTFYEGKSVLGLLTHKPAVKGHILVIPKRHAARFEDLTNEEMIEIKETIVRVNRMFQKFYGTSGYFLMEKNGKEAGQSVPHVHFHYLPRKEGDNRFFLGLQIFIAPLLKPWTAEAMRTQADEWEKLLTQEEKCS